jgi:hypothetical protein
MSTLTPATTWPFAPGQAVYHVPFGNHRRIHPVRCVPATVVTCTAKRVRIRDNDGRETSVRNNFLGYRGYCARCPAPASVAADGSLICTRCGGTAYASPPPDDLIARWFPLGCWQTPMIVRRAVACPGWSWQTAAAEVRATTERAYLGMLERLGLSRLYMPCSNEHTSPNDLRNDYADLQRLTFFALLGAERAFAETHRALDVRQYCAVAGLEQHVTTVDDDLPAPQPSEPPMQVVRDIDDSAPDGDVDTPIDRWLNTQFRRAA